MRAKKLKETKKGASIDADNRILTVRNDTESNTLNVRNDNATNSSSDQNNRTRKNEKSCEGNMKRKREDDEPDYEGLTLLFDESNEDTLVESIDEKILEQENVLLKASGDSVLKSQLKNMDPRIVEAFCAYQETIPKSRKILTPAYWGVLDLTGESLFDCKQITEDDIMQLLQDFTDKLTWKMMPTEQNICEYFDSNCEQKTDNNFDIRK
ncbi:hypothetical protein F8M41_007156 [Gigaspora margarita]|uniref:Uncharacterized protein n=1 Tax=Gigaspora margarita TaxID=4874 RepID=A0A8H4ERF6_GIGMA|nr:hypothetical protein F8M41_007156 [Gigaspora margarita]